MPEPTQGNATGPVSQPETNPPAPPAPGPVSTQRYAHEDVYAEDGVLYKEKFFGAQGRAKEIQRQSAEAIGVLQQQLETERARTKQFEAQVKQLEQSTERVGTLQDTVAALQNEVTDLTKQAALVEKYRVFSQHPELLAVQVERTVEQEGQEPIVVKENPLLKLAETSQLSGDDLVQTLKNIAAALPGLQSPTATPAPIAQPPATPAPSEPVEDDIAALKAKAWQAQQLIGEGDASAWDTFWEATDRIREIERSV